MISVNHDEQPVKHYVTNIQNTLLGHSESAGELVGSLHSKDSFHQAESIAPNVCGF